MDQYFFKQRLSLQNKSDQADKSITITLYGKDFHVANLTEICRLLFVNWPLMIQLLLDHGPVRLQNDKLIY